MTDIVERIVVLSNESSAEGVFLSSAERIRYQGLDGGRCREGALVKVVGDLRA